MVDLSESSGGDMLQPLLLLLLVVFVLTAVFDEDPHVVAVTHSGSVC